MTEKWIKAFTAICVCLGFLYACSSNSKDTADGFIQSARTYIKQNKSETAIIEYKNAIQADPKNDIPYFELAETYVITGKLDQAIRCYRLAVQVNPERVINLVRLAQVYLQTDQLLDARIYIYKVQELAPDTIEIYHLLSGVQIKE